jgi:hypothetical protein
MSEYTAAQLGLHDTEPGPQHTANAPYVENTTTAAAKDVVFGSVCCNLSLLDTLR